MVSGDYMTVYVDVLIFINAVTDYLLLNLSSLISGCRINTVRLVITSVVAAMFSLMIFLPYLGGLAELFIRMSTAVLICLTGYGYKCFKRFLKNYLAFLTVSVAFNGLMTVVWVSFKPKGMILNNSVVYFNISALETIVFTAVSYFIIRLVLSVIKRVSPLARRCRIKFIHNGKSVEVTGMVDSGNSLKDVYSDRHVIITDRSVALEIFGVLEYNHRLLLPYKTVGGAGVLDAYPCKKAYINNNDAGAVLVAVSDEKIDGDYKAIVNPEILNIG